MRKVLFLFGQLNDDDVEWMLAKGDKRFLPAGASLIEQGVPVDAVFILLEGRLAVWLRGRRGPEREIARLNAGEIVGEMSFVDARPPSATVRVLEDSIVFAISKVALNAKLAADQGFAARFYRALAIYLSTTVRERHRALGYGTALAEDGGEEEDADELDVNVLDGVYLAGERFDRMVKRVMVS
ncbi:MAG TPA: cyclic nucleotide-binding domain-containing protein [Thermoanaerobaculia bacterium]|jgi:CRP-like cAMP-binding protein|nr:cyclic nucleotide-binding domain-containing protein [Thermoanaerobaculia bacterium]